jgi:dihydrofolate reductase
MMLITLVAAMTRKGIIGKNQGLPWHFPEDLKHFKKVTLGKPVVMGRKTFESIGSKPLPNRDNIILTHDPNFTADRCVIAHSIEGALKVAKPAEEVMIIGGSAIYKQFLPIAHRFYLTLIHQNYQGDTYFPSIDWEEWITISEDDKDDFTIKLLEKSSALKATNGFPP